MNKPNLDVILRSNLGLHTLLDYPSQLGKDVFVVIQ
jgi:hypothetical protein